MTHFILTRHGESVWHAENRYAGSSDIDLTPRGYKESEMLACWAQTADLDAIWVSPLSRAQETAMPTAQITGLKLHIDARLRELDFGIAEGKTAAEMEIEHHDVLKAFQADPIANPFPEGENPNAAADRSIACLREAAQIDPDGRILVVMHNTLLRLTLCRLIDIPLSCYRTVFPFVNNCSLTEIKVEHNVTSLLMFNSPIEAHVASISLQMNQTEILS
jgi:broad specificity phosphatase PhoE